MTVFITGSSRGIGLAIGKEFNKLGYNIVLNCSKSLEQLDKACEELSQTNPNVIGVQGDVSVYDDVDRIFNNIENKFGGVDILVNNAGISHSGLFSDMTEKQWKKIMDVNINSVYNCCHRALPYMLKNKKGSIVNISSIWGVSGASYEVVYSASKAAVNQFTKALGKELAPAGIRVNGIACGAIDTEMNDNLSEEEKKAFAYQIPIGRFGEPKEIGEAVVFLASEKAQYIIGQIINIDGGFL